MSGSGEAAADEEHAESVVGLVAAGLGVPMGLAGYGTSKWAMRGLTKMAAKELARDNILSYSLSFVLMVVLGGVHRGHLGVHEHRRPRRRDELGAGRAALGRGRPRPGAGGVLRRRNHHCPHRASSS